MNKIDPYRGLKYVGYLQGQLPDRYSLGDLIRYAKFQLALKTKTLLKDPIWDNYTVEELLSEYFAHLFHESKDAKLAFEKSMEIQSSDVVDFEEWANAEIAKEDKIREETLESTEDSVSFNPNKDLGDIT